MDKNLRDRITRALNKELLAQLPDALSGGNDLAPSRSGTINLPALADAVIRELTPILLDFGEWLAEEVGFRRTPVDLQSCLEDWRGD